MTPKEKAEELVGKYHNSPIIWVHFYEAKQLALIAVDEILLEYPSQCPKESYEMERHLFWKEVRKEIEAL
jgi:hypothetical protein